MMHVYADLKGDFSSDMVSSPKLLTGVQDWIRINHYRIVYTDLKALLEKRVDMSKDNSMYGSDNLLKINGR
jgi:hypothetical protein